MWQIKQINNCRSTDRLVSCVTRKWRAYLFFGCSDIMQCGIWACSTDVYKVSNDNTSCGAKPWCRGTRPFTSRKNCKTVLHTFSLYKRTDNNRSVKTFKGSRHWHLPQYIATNPAWNKLVCNYSVIGMYNTTDKCIARQYFSPMQYLTYNQRQNCWGLFLRNGYIFQRTKQSTPVLPSLNSKIGCLLFSIGSSNSGRTLVEGVGAGKLYVGKTSDRPLRAKDLNWFCCRL